MPRTALYRLFDIENVLLYAGTTEEVSTRLKHHALMKKWWPRVTRHTVEWLADRDTAEAEERRVIRVEAPLFNVQHDPVRNPVTRVSWWEFVMDATANTSHSEIARRCGLSQPSVTQWRKSTPNNKSIRAFAAAYEMPVVRAFIAASITTEDEVLEFAEEILRRRKV